MADTLIGMVTFGNVEFTKLAYRSIQETTKNHDIDFFFIVGKPGDKLTINFLDSINCTFKVHNENLGFPYSLNDIYDYAWKENNYKNLILAGNDIVVYPYAVDSLIDLADTSDITCISALQYDVRSLIAEHPETKQDFIGGKLLFTNFNKRPWELFTGYSNDPAILPMQLFDIQNLCLYKRDVFDAVGYTDVNFYPAYYVDNDYALRIWRAQLKSATLANARFFHFWSRTIHQGVGGSTDKAFQLNEGFYREKWGGMPTKETKSPDIKIDNRDNELSIINMWKGKIR